MRTGPLLPIIVITVEAAAALVYGWLGYDSNLIGWLAAATLTAYTTCQ